MTSGIARAGWDIDLRDGEAREDAFAYVLLRARVEHKSDEACRRTGNVFIEVEQKGRPSGLSISTADWWAIEVDKDTWVFLPRERLKDLVREIARTDKRRIVMGGDGNQYKGVLVPVSKLVQPIRAVCEQPNEGEY